MQSSKLSGVLYVIHTNESPELHELLSDADTMMYLADHNTLDTSKVEHSVIDLVDDSNSTLIFNDKDYIN